MRCELEMTIEQLQSLNMVLTKIGDVKQAKLAYMIAKNKSIIKVSLDAFKEALKPSEEAIAYERAREKLLVECVKKDKKGEPIRVPVKGMVGAWQYMIEDEESFKDKIDELQKEHVKGVKDINDLEELRKQLLSESEEVSLHYIKISDIKEDENGNFPISADHLGSLISMGLVIDEDEDDDKDKK